MGALEELPQSQTSECQDDAQGGILVRRVRKRRLVRTDRVNKQFQDRYGRMAKEVADRKIEVERKEGIKAKNQETWKNKREQKQNDKKAGPGGKADAFRILQEAQEKMHEQQLEKSGRAKATRKVVDAQLPEDSKNVQRAAQTATIQGKQLRLKPLTKQE